MSTYKGILENAHKKTKKRTLLVLAIKKLLVKAELSESEFDKVIETLKKGKDGFLTKE
jgi:hypothetical protein